MFLYFKQGCQIFIDLVNQRDTKLAINYQMAKNVPNGRNIFQIAREYTILFHSKALQNLHTLGFRFENKPSGNPDFKIFHSIYDGGTHQFEQSRVFP
jgi:hypothetical protein